jgi:hypothetical protein
MYFEQLNQFCFYKREELLKYSASYKNVTNQKKHYFWRTRTQFGRNDLVLLVRKKDLDHLEHHSITLTK